MSGSRGQGRTRHVVIVGAGVVGAMLAYELVRRDVRVTLLEREEPAAGTTGASFAWLTSQAQYRAGDSISLDQAREYFYLHRLAHSGWRRLQHDIGNDLGVRWCGTVEWEPHEADGSTRLAVELERRVRWGAMTRPIGREDIERLVPGVVTGPVGTAMHTADDGCVDPQRAVAAVLDAAAALGLVVHHPCEVTGFETAQSRAVAVRTSADLIDCDDVVITAGVDTAGLARQVGIAVPLVESVGVLVHLEAMPPVLGPIMYAPSVHMLQRPDGRVVVSRHFSGVPQAQPPKDLDVDELMADATAILPALSAARIERVTRGRRVLPADGLPIVGRSEEYPNVRAVATNAGVSLGPILAQLLTTELLDDTEVDLLSDYRSTRFAART